MIQLSTSFFIDVRKNNKRGKESYSKRLQEEVTIFENNNC